ncbi:LOW QUALITY PROTEIN: myelin protein P0, partial [Gastrophryne carolinensis]
LALSPALAIEVYTDREIHGTVGSKVHLSCTFWSSEWISDDISVTWHYQPDNSRDRFSILHYTKGEVVVDDTGLFKNRLEWVGYPRSKDGSIILHNLEFADNGTFTCDVKNPPDVVGKASYVHLLVFDKAPVRAGMVLGIIIGAALGLVIIVALLAYLIRYCWLRRQYQRRRELSALEKGRLHKLTKGSSKGRQAPLLSMLDQSRSFKSGSDKKKGLGDSRKDRKQLAGREGTQKADEESPCSSKVIYTIEMELRGDEGGDQPYRAAVKSPSKNSLKNALKNLIKSDSEKHP